ncbi:hypothetical protein [Rhizobium sp. Root1220]|uniref:hypothetical protein n=1 Tax=Rhizobium sp. Root1220 TaxID=1736432 RepID=UPI0006FA176F|nr:hypothetical protein [Rhizobium sp. Root1220]KQV84349.1 hypothetical protein ASC90_02170 [Rhizobium sp. Root1220]
MNYPHIKTLTIRFVEIDGTAYIPARDFGQSLGLTADEDGDYRSALTEAGIPYTDLAIFDQDEPLGPHALLTEADFNQARSVNRG